MDSFADYFLHESFDCLGKEKEKHQFHNHPELKGKYFTMLILRKQQSKLQKD